MGYGLWVMGYWLWMISYGIRLKVLGYTVRGFRGLRVRVRV
jgi:hypothetical protein